MTQELPPRAVNDCRVSSFLRTKWGTQSVTACTTPRCVLDAQPARQPFVLEVTPKVLHRAVARAYVGVMEQGAYVVYAAYYDPDPCDGRKCFFEGGTRLHKCRSIVEKKPCDGEPCLVCADSVEVEYCKFGGRSPDD